MENGIFKKIELISKSGFLASSLLNIGAMNNIVIKDNQATIQNIKKIGNNFENVKECKEIKLENISQLMTLQQLTKFLDKYKEDIILPVHQGDETRKNAYNEAKIVHKSFGNFMKNLIFENFIKNLTIKEKFNIDPVSSKENDKEKKIDEVRKKIINSKYKNIIKNLKESEIEKIIPEKITEKYPLKRDDLYKLGEFHIDLLYKIFKFAKCCKIHGKTLDKIKDTLYKLNIDTWVEYDKIKESIKEEKNILKYLCIKIAKKPEETKKTIEKNWHNIGRGILHHDYTSPDKRNLKKQLDNCRNGVINCTVWAEIIWWFLNSNGYPAKLIDCSNHRLVEVPIIENKNIKLKTIEVNENTDSLDEITFKIKDIVNRKDTREEIWKSLQNAEYDNGKNNEYVHYTNPTFRYFGPLLKYMKWSYCYDYNTINGFFLELKSIFNNFKKSKDIEYNLKNGIIKYSLNILPSKSYNEIKTIYIPLNLDDIYLSENKDEKGGTIFKNIKKPKFYKETTEFLYTAFSMDNLTYEVRIDDTNKLFIFQSSDDNLYGQLYSKKLPNYIIKLPIFRIHECSPKYYKHNKNDAIFFNYTTYKKNTTIDVKNPTFTLDNNFFCNNEIYEENFM